MKSIVLNSIIIIALIIINISSAKSQSASQNYIYSYEIQIPGYMISSQITPSISPTHAVQTIQYFDGLGRLSQTIQPYFTPEGKALITPKTYNEVGLDEINYQPYTDNSVSIAFRNGNDFPRALAEFYDDNFSDPAGYAPTKYEKSPLNRVLKQGAPGTPWGIDAGHPVIYSYLTNSITKSFLKAIIWRVDGDNCVKGSLYTAGELYVTGTMNEDLSETYEFKNKQGQVILKEQLWNQTSLLTPIMFMMTLDC